LAGRPVWLHSAERFAARDDVRQLIVVVSPEDEQWFRDEYAEDIQRLKIEVVRGGAERFESVQLALNTVWESTDYVAVHDAARPCVSEESIDAVFQAARRHDAAMLAAPVVGTVKRIDEDRIVETVPREVIWEAQTPQVFERRLLINAYAERYGRPTDDAQLVERLGKEVFIISGDRRNIKITTQEDFEMLQRMLTETD
jgi:2-C-methyl-D-erythritol 4-phosphate cytidylyltransferase